MVKNLTPDDLLLLQAEVLFGSNPPPGTPFDSLLGLRSVDGANNNMSGVTALDGFIDQYGNPVDTATFGYSSQPFIHQTSAHFPTIVTNNGTADYTQTPNTPGAALIAPSPPNI